MRAVLQAFPLFCLLVLGTPSPSSGQSSPATRFSEAVSNRTLSESGRFSILGGTTRTRADLAKRCERLSRDFLQVTGFPDRSTQRIIVQVHERAQGSIPQRRAVGRIFPLSAGSFRFQLDLLSDEDFQWRDFEREMIKLFLLSQSFAENPGKQVRDRLPTWTLTGTLELIGYRRGERPADVFAALLDSRQMLTLEEVLNSPETRDKDSVTAGIHAACSAALVETLLEQPSGSARFLAFLSDLSALRTAPEELLREHFPALRQEPKNLEKWWALQVAAMSQKTTFEYLDVEETEAQLEELLLVRSPSPASVKETAASGKGEENNARPWQGWDWNLNPFRRRPPKGEGTLPEDFQSAPLRSYDQFLGFPWAREMLQDKRAALAGLQAVAFPLYREVLAGYDQILAALDAGKTDGVVERLDQLESARKAIRLQMQGIDDHINWYSTTQIDEMSDEFDGYAQALRFLENLETRKRNDPISRYLDAMEREMTP